MPRLQSAFMLTDKGYKDLKGAILALTITHFSMTLPLMVVMQLILALLAPLTGGEISWPKMWLLFGAGLIAALIVFICHRSDYKKTYTATYQESEQTRVALAEHIRKLPMSLFNSKDLAELTTNLMDDVATSEHTLSHVVPQLIASAISITGICVSMALFDWRMALSMFITVPVALVTVVLSRGLYGKLHQKHMRAKLAASGQLQEYIEGIKVIRACNMDGEQFTALKDAVQTMKRLAIRMELGTGVFVTGAQMILQAGIGLTVLLGTTLLTGGAIEPVQMLMFMLIVVRIYSPVLAVLSLLPELFYHQIGIRRMRDLMAFQPMEGRKDAPIGDMTLRFEQVSFRYHDGADAAIRDMTATFPAGSVTALVGPSGSGKSTVSRLMARFWDVDAGRVTLGGVDVRSIDPEHLMGRMSFVFQDVVLFQDTVLNNIRIGNRDATREQVLAAAQAARCDEFIARLPQGYETVIGENGQTLSGGERQRLSIARALLKDAPIVLLDEATASLDPESEAAVQQAIAALIEGKTVIVIAHRLRTVAGADQILVLDQGRLVEQGTHARLMEINGLYAGLYRTQQESLGWSVGARRAPPTHTPRARHAPASPPA